MLNATALWKPIEAWAERHWALLGAFGHALAFAVLFGGVALAALTSGFTDTADPRSSVRWQFCSSDFVLG